MTFAPGAIITDARGAGHGSAWLEHPVVVESDDGPDGVLAAVLADGSPFTFPRHPVVRTPGQHRTLARRHRAPAATARRLVLGLEVLLGPRRVRRAGTSTSSGRSCARPTGIDTDDLELDLVVLPDGARRWKDVEHLAARLDQRRFGIDELVAVLRAAADVTDLLDRDVRWWSPWDDWSPDRH